MNYYKSHSENNDAKGQENALQSTRNWSEGFWSFANEMMTKYHDISPDKFLLYIKAMVCRCNNRDCDTFPLLSDYLLVVNN